MKKPLTILVDYGGTIARDSDAFEEIAIRSGNKDNVEFSGPESWDSIKYVGNDNYFAKREESYFRDAIFYPHAAETIDEFYEANGPESNTNIHIVFDNRPKISSAQNKILALFAKEFANRKIKANGFYVASDKIKLARELGANILIEDDPRIALAIANNGIKVVLLLRKWNRDFNLTRLKLVVPESKMKNIRDNIYLAEDWVDASKIISEIILKERGKV